ncbi:nuclear transport factor 2 family protein [Alysiella filiformis]|uniref:DUF4440 domain-containing protein n=1 Tax=Alysiella filiformis DSM 16848 TaxID=1120981 RepID=A0A286E7W3_9NEIS|nr:nuclear transport factor 2 family protein [Alysiella filiformis]QMT32016.1 nuclear transport factor 2 family protein [Alysiella filiformis]UBQ57075.1 nuclear transport factor 2 family protein [Alysiella filiformis DSM 16848]SOD66980.1 protein of unknown function [Alysiella filiformis DSM 16848]
MMMTEQAIIEKIFDDYMNAVIQADFETIRQLCDKNLTLTHVTGYVQPLEDFLAYIHHGTFHYFSYEKQICRITINGNQAEMYVKGQTDAEIYGTRKIWQIGQTLSFAKQKQTWQIMKIVV